MNEIFWYDGKREAQSVWTSNMNAAAHLVEALEKNGWKVVWMIHSLDITQPMKGYEKAFKIWKEDVKNS